MCVHSTHVDQMLFAKARVIDLYVNVLKDLVVIQENFVNRIHLTDASMMMNAEVMKYVSFLALAYEIVLLFVKGSSVDQMQCVKGRGMLLSATVGRVSLVMHMISSEAVNHHLLIFVKIAQSA